MRDYKILGGIAILKGLLEDDVVGKKEEHKFLFNWIFYFVKITCTVLLLINIFHLMQ